MPFYSIVLQRFQIGCLNVVEIFSYLRFSQHPSSNPVIHSLIWRPKQEKQLPKELSTNTLDAYRISLILAVELSTIDISKLHSVSTLLDCRVTRNFIDHNFVCSKGINTQTIFHPIPIFNIDSSSNEASQISEVVDIVLHY